MYINETRIILGIHGRQNKSNPMVYNIVNKRRQNQIQQDSERQADEPKKILKLTIYSKLNLNKQVYCSLCFVSLEKPVLIALYPTCHRCFCSHFPQIQNTSSNS